MAPRPLPRPALRARLRATLAAALAAAVLLAGCGGGAADADRLVAATDATYPPFESRDASGAIVGFDADLLRAVGREAGLAVELVDQRFEGILPGLRQGKYDAVISCLTITPERAKEVDFSDPYYDAGQVIAVAGKETGIRGLADLRGRTLAVQINTTGKDAADRVEGATVRAFDTIDLAFLELLAGRAAAVINDEPTTLLYAREHPGIRVVGAPFTQERYGIAVRRGNADLLRRLNAGLAKVRASGEYDRLRARWIGAAGR